MKNKIIPFVLSAIAVTTSCYAGQLRPCEAYVLEIASDGARIAAPTPIHLRKGWNYVKLTLPNPSAKDKARHRRVGTFIPVAGTTDHPQGVEGLTYASEPPHVLF